MPRVPVYESQVQQDTKVIPQVKQSPRPPVEAFGLGNIKANMNVAEELINAGQMLTSHAARMAAEDNRKAFIKADSDFRLEIQNMLLSDELDENSRPVGFLNRKLDQVGGSVDEFDEKFKPVSEKYLTSVPPSERNSMLQSVKSHYQSAREAILKNVVDERNKDFEVSLKSNIENVVAGASIIKDPEDLRNSIEIETENIGKSLYFISPNKDYVNSAKQKIAGDMVKASVTSMIETDHVRAKSVLDGSKDLISESVYNELNKILDSKSFEDLKEITWESVQGLRLSDGNSDLESMKAKVYSMNMPTEQKEKVWDHVRSSASVQDSILRDQRNSANRAFTNDVISQHSQGLDYQSALRLASKYSYDATDLANKQRDVTNLYSGVVNNFDLWINKQPEETQAAWDYAKNILKTKFDDKEKEIDGIDGKVNLYQAAISELKIQSLNKSPDAIRKLANEKIKDVVVSPRSWLPDIISPEIIRDVSVRQVTSEAVSKLEELYGADTVSEAREYLIRNNKNDSPANIAALINKRIPQ